MKAGFRLGALCFLVSAFSGCGSSSEDEASNLSDDQAKPAANGSVAASAQPSAKALVYDDANDAIWTASGAGRVTLELAMAGGVGYFDTRIAGAERCLYAFEYENADTLDLELLTSESGTNCPRGKPQISLKRTAPNSLDITSENAALLPQPLTMTTRQRNLLKNEYSVLPDQLDIVGLKIGGPINAVAAKLVDEMGYTETRPNLIASQAFNVRAFVKDDGADEILVSYNRLPPDNPFVGDLKPTVFSITRKVTPEGGIAFDALRSGLVSKYGLDAADIKPVLGKTRRKVFDFAPDGASLLPPQGCQKRSSFVVLNRLGGSNASAPCGTKLIVKMEALGKNSGRIGTYEVGVYSGELAHPLGWYGNNDFAPSVVQKARQYLKKARQAPDEVPDL